MAGAKVQSAHNNANGVTSLTITPTNNLGSGNLMVVSFFGRLLTSSSITGTTGWTKQVTSTSNGGALHQIWTAPVQAGDVGTKPVMTFSSGGGADWMTVIWAELSGVDTSSTPFSTSASNHNSSSNTTPTSGATGTSGANEFGLGIISIDGGTVPAADTGLGFTDLELVNTSLPADMEYKTVNSTTLTATHTLPSADFWSEVAVVLKLSGGAAGLPDGTRHMQPAHTVLIGW